MTEISSFHRDAARILREQARIWDLRAKKRKARFFRDQALWHEVEATRLDDTERLESHIQDTALLFVREALLQGWSVGYLVDAENPDAAAIYVQHKFLGPLAWAIPTAKIPGWIPVFKDIPAALTSDYDMWDRIDKYIRPLESDNRE